MYKVFINNIKSLILYLLKENILKDLSIKIRKLQKRLKLFLLVAKQIRGLKHHKNKNNLKIIIRKMRKLKNRMDILTKIY